MNGAPILFEYISLVNPTSSLKLPHAPFSSNLGIVTRGRRNGPEKSIHHASDQKHGGRPVTCPDGAVNTSAGFVLSCAH
jgi:hypothetical protein